MKDGSSCEDDSYEISSLILTVREFPKNRPTFLGPFYIPFSNVPSFRLYHQFSLQVASYLCRKRLINTVNDVSLRFKPITRQHTGTYPGNVSSNMSVNEILGEF